MLLAASLEEDEEEGFGSERWDGWPLELRCLFGYPAFFIFMGLLIWLGFEILWEKLFPEKIELGGSGAD